MRTSLGRVVSGGRGEPGINHVVINLQSDSQFGLGGERVHSTLAMAGDGYQVLMFAELTNTLSDQL